MTAFAPSEHLNPSLRAEDQEMDMRPQIVGPPAYGSPNPETAGGRLVPLHEHPLKDKLSDDYGGDHLAGADLGQGSVTLDEMSVANLRALAKERGIEGTGKLNKSELIAVLSAQSSEEEDEGDDSDEGDDEETEDES